MDEIGEALHSAREASGVSISEASKDLDIKEEILVNIEDGRTGAFKDIFELKEYITNYAKYLGLDETALIDEFNDYMFEYTSRIPVKEIEKTISQMAKEETKNEVESPYTKTRKKYNNWVYVIIYVFVALLVMLAILWSVKQVTINRNNTNTISYGGK